MGALRPSLIGLVSVALLGGLGAVAATAQDQSSPGPSAAPPPVGEACEPVDLPYDPEEVHLTGVWSDDRGNVAYISQAGSRIYLMHLTGRDEPPDQLGRFWTVVATGTLADDGTVSLDYGVVPRGDWLLDDFGTLTGGFAVQPGEATRFTLRYPETAYRPQLTYVFKPCAVTTRITESLKPALTFRDEPRVGLSLIEGPGLAVMPASDHAGTQSGVVVWSITPTSAMTCEGKPGQPIEPGAEAFLAWLRSREDLLASDPVPVTVDGRPATMMDLTPAPGATGCLEDGKKLRLWTVYGADAAVFTDSMARVILLDVGDSTLAIEMYGDDQDAWLPLAQEVVDTFHFVE